MQKNNWPVKWCNNSNFKYLIKLDKKKRKYETCIKWKSSRGPSSSWGDIEGEFYGSEINHSIASVENNSPLPRLKPYTFSVLPRYLDNRRHEGLKPPSFNTSKNLLQSWEQILPLLVGENPGKCIFRFFKRRNQKFFIYWGNVAHFAPEFSDFPACLKN